MCGICAVSTKKELTKQQQKKVKDKMRILAMYNQWRGEHGCGIFINGQIIKGGDDTKDGGSDTRLIGDLLATEPFNPMNFPDFVPGECIIMHTRQATKGAQTKENNHPFLIEAENPEDNLVFCHNGTIDNIWPLCTANKIDHSSITVDSKGLGMLISKVGTSILEQYKGAAAIVYTKESKSDEMWVFHGAQKKEKDDKYIYPERPMYYMETDEGIFFSSMEESLNAIRDKKDQTPIDLRYNHVFKVRSGKWQAKADKIDREFANKVTPVVPATTYNNNYNRSRFPHDDDYDLESDWNNYYKGHPSAGFNNHIKAQNRTKPKIEIALNAKYNNSLVFRETVPYKHTSDLSKTLVYFHKGRFWMPSETLCHGILHLKNKGEVVVSKGLLDMNCKSYFFWNGVMLNDRASYDQMIAFDHAPDSWLRNPKLNFANRISKYSQWPVTNLPSESTEIEAYHRFCWYWNEKRAFQGFQPKFATRYYDLAKNGFLIGIKANQQTYDSKTIIDDVNTSVAVVTPEKPTPELFKDKEEGYGFDRAFLSFEDANKRLTAIEFKSICLVCEEILNATVGVNTTEEDAEISAWEIVRNSVKNCTTIRKEMKDKAAGLDIHFMNLLFASKDKADSLDYTDVEDVTEADLPDSSIPDVLEKQEATEIEQEEAEGHIEDIIGLLGEINEHCDELQVLNECGLAQDMAYDIYKLIDNIKHKVVEIGEKHKVESIIKLVNQKVNSLTL